MGEAYLMGNGKPTPSHTMGILKVNFAATKGENTLHLYAGENMFQCIIDWGDGFSTICPANGGLIKHNYLTGTCYDITIIGTKFGGFHVNCARGAEKYYSITLDKSLGGFSECERTDYSNCFFNCYFLHTISEELFDNSPHATDFSSCFNQCGITEIPYDLFRNCKKATNFDRCFASTKITRIPAFLFENCPEASIFYSCFTMCTELSSLPGALFANCWRKPLWLRGLFSYCTSLTNLPENLFEHCGSALGFNSCFAECVNLESIPAELFRECRSAQDFGYCFNNCINLSGIVPELWLSAHLVPQGGERCFGGCTRVQNYMDIPDNWK